MNKKMMIYIYFIINTALIIYIPLTGHVNDYAYPTATMASIIINNGHINIPELQMSIYWEGALTIERDYPVPAILLAITRLITAFPGAYVPYIPLSGFLPFLLYFAISKMKTEKKVILIYLLISYSLFIRIQGFYVGRATLGVAFQVLIVYLVLRLILMRDVKSFWLVNIVLIESYFTYYTTIITSTSIFFYIFITNRIRVLSIPSYIDLPVKFLLIISLNLLIFQPIVYTFSTISVFNFFTNLFSTIGVFLKINRGEAYALHVGNVDVDIFARITSIWIGWILKLLVILVLLFYIITKLIKFRKLDASTFEDVMAIIAIGSFTGELFYTVVAPTLSLRYLIMFSIFILPVVLQRKWITSLMLSLFIMFYIGTIYSVFVYGTSGQPFLLQRVIVFFYYYTPVVVTGSSYDTGYLFYTTYENFHSFVVHYTTLGSLSLKLFGANIDDIKFAISQLLSRNIRYLVFIDNGKPVFGDAWGYAITPSYLTKNLLSNTNILYNAHPAYLYYLFNTIS
jgi:hypothetical protein